MRNADVLEGAIKKCSSCVNLLSRRERKFRGTDFYWLLLHVFRKLLTASSLYG